MGRPKKYHTEEERKEAIRRTSRIKQARWRANNPQKSKEITDRYKANNPEKVKEAYARYKAKSKDKLNESARKSYSKRKGDTFLVYEHTLGSKKYIGMGHHLRPYDFSSRKTHWKESFTTKPTVKIIAEFKTREEALKYEYSLIEEIGLENLVNVIK